MSWWHNPGLPGISVDPASVRFPVELELIPELVLASVDLVQFQIGQRAVDCWTYQTKGLIQFGQKELILAVKQPQGQAIGNFPAAPLDFFKNVCQYVLKGEYLEAGSITTFGDSGFLSGRFKALGYVQPPATAQQTMQPDGLWALLMTKNEMEAARLGGLSRVVALLGKNDLHFPCPLWNDLEREDSVSNRMLEVMLESPITEFPRMTLHAAAVSRMGNVLEVVIPISKSESFNTLYELDEEMPVAILTGIDATADGFLVWQPDQKHPLAITAPGFPGDRLGGAYICFVPDQTDDVGLISDDGFAYSLRTSTWREVRKALAAKRDCSVKATTTGFDLKIQWVEDKENIQLNQLRQKSLLEAAALTTHDAPVIDSSTVPARATTVRLGTHETEIARLVDPTVLSAYIQHLEDVVRDHFFCEGQSEGFDLILECTLEPAERVSFTVSTKPVIEADDETAVIDRLSLTYPPVLPEGKIEFVIEFAVWGGAGALPGENK